MTVNEDSSSSGEQASYSAPVLTSGQASATNNPTLLSSLRSVLFVVSSALIGFAAARNSLTW